MKHYLVMCKDEQQWDDYVVKHEKLLGDSLTYNLEIREGSLIFHDVHRPGEGRIYIKILPKMIDNYPASYLSSKCKIWLCKQEEFV